MTSARGDVQMVEQAARVFGHGRGAIFGGVIELLALAVAPSVHGDDAEPGAVQRLDPIGVAPVDGAVRGKAVDEQDRIAGALIDIGDGHTIGVETLHSCRLAVVRRLASVMPMRRRSVAQMRLDRFRIQPL